MQKLSCTTYEVWIVLVVALLVVGCSSPAPPPVEATPLPAPTFTPEIPTPVTVEKFTIYLIAGGDRGRNGKPAGCNDSVVPVEWDTDPTDQPLREALEFLLSIKEQRVGPPGLYNAIYQSNLDIESIEIDAEGHASVRLSGDMQVSGLCDRLRFQAQIEETVLNTPNVRSADILINGTPLEELVSGQ